MKKYLILDLLGILVIVAAIFIEKIDLSSINIETLKEIVNIRLSGWYSFFFILYYIILHSIRYHFVDEFDESGMYHVEEYVDGILEHEYDQYQTHTGSYLGINYLVFHLILILFHNSILGFIITYGAILVRDFIAYIDRNHPEDSSIGVVLTSIIWLVLFICCLVNSFDNGFADFAGYFYYAVLPCICFCFYLPYCASICNSVSDNEGLGTFYYVNFFIVGFISICCLIILLGYIN